MSTPAPAESWWLGLTLACITLLLWGTLPVVLKMLLQSLDPYTITWYRFLLAGGILVPIVAWRYGLASPFKIRGATLALAIACVLGLCGNYLTYLMGLHRVPPGSAQVVMQCSPIFVLLGGLIFFKEPFSRLQWIGFFVLIIGMLLFFNRRYAALLAGVEIYAQGIWLVFASAVLWAIFMLAQKPLLRHLPSVSVMALVYWFGVLLYWPLASPGLGLSLPTRPLLLLGCSVIFTLISYLSFAEALKRMEASRMGALVALSPLITMALVGLLALIRPGLVEIESLNELGVTGAVLVVVGAMCSSLGRSRGERS